MSKNEYTDADGTTYEAKPSTLLCLGCAHDMPTSVARSSCNNAEPCCAIDRKDKRSIIWVVKK